MNEEDRTYQIEFEKLKTELLTLFQQFSDNYEEYLDNFHFEKFEKQTNTPAIKNLRKSETIFDRNYETILRNNILLNESEKIVKEMKKCINSIGEIKVATFYQ